MCDFHIHATYVPRAKVHDLAKEALALCSAGDLDGASSD